MKLSGRSLHLALTARSLPRPAISRALSLALATMLWASAASADSPISSPYQKRVYSVCTGNPCSATFPAVTAETLILDTTCEIIQQNSNGLVDAYLSNGPQNVISFLPFFFNVNVNGYSYYTIATQTYMFFSSGEQPIIEASAVTGTLGSVSCTVSGYSRSALPPMAGTAQPPDAPSPPTPAGLPPSPGLPPFIRAPAQ